MADVPITITVEAGGDGDGDVATIEGSHWVLHKRAHPCMRCRLNNKPEAVRPLGPGLHHGCRCYASLESGDGSVSDVLR